MHAIMKAAPRALLTATLLLTPAALRAQWSTTYEQFYLQAPHNWQFRTHYSSADRLFNAFDYGHAILYETLWRFPDAPASRLEEDRYRFLTETVLIKPPRLPLEEGAIEPMYARLAPEAKVMFDWAHLLHRQLYDVLADERMSWDARDAEIARLVRYYRSRPELAFSSKPKSMRLMQEQPYSLAFRKKYPKFNGLIWGYHWLQMGLYEPLMVGTTRTEKQALIRGTVARFFQMLNDVPQSLPHQMPMTVAVAPKFAERYPEAAIIFDNLHSMHDVVSDILTNPSVPRNAKRTQIMLAARRFRDDTTEVMSVPAWRVMSEHMGIENMGGPSVGFLPTMPTPSVTFGAVMQHDPQTGAMTGFGYGGAVGGGHDMHTGHNMAAPAPAAAAAADPHAGHATPAGPSDSAQVATLVAAFHAALEGGDSTKALSLLTADVVILEGGSVETLADYRAHHLPADIAFARVIKAERQPRAVTVSGDVAYSVSTSAAKGNYNDRAVDTLGAELIVARRLGGRWQISAIHWSSRRRP
ncbi:MAG: nuclear transport factor 2 family protein [Gemmatimonas sp.]|nr:nuclear transport factor 2 family protein [Gemmatimonas sp.]